MRGWVGKEEYEGVGEMYVEKGGNGPCLCCKCSCPFSMHGLCRLPDPTPPDPPSGHLFQVQRTLFPFLLPPSLTTPPPTHHPLTH